MHLYACTSLFLFIMVILWSVQVYVVKMSNRCVPLLAVWQWFLRGTVCFLWRSMVSSRTSLEASLSSEQANARPRSLKSKEPSTCDPSYVAAGSCGLQPLQRPHTLVQLMHLQKDWWNCRRNDVSLHFFFIFYIQRLFSSAVSFC